MRELEALSWFIAVAGLAWWLVRPPARRIQLGVAATWLAIVLLQALIEGARAHLVPIYLLGAAIALSAWWRPRRLARGLAAVPVTAVAALALALPLIFPVYSYDPLRGPYGVGTAVYGIPAGDSDHELAFQVWYPAAPDADGPRAGISPRPDLVADADARVAGVPALLFDHLRLVRTHAVEGAPLAPSAARFPVILFSHGPIAANRSQSIFQMEALASAGFVVVAIDHTGYSSVTIMPDGRATPARADAAWPVFADERGRALVDRWIDDVHRVLDEVVALDQHDPTGLLAGRLDLDRVGYLGASFGGSVVVEALTRDPRIKVGVAEDGKPYFFDGTPERLDRPLLYLQSAQPYIPVGADKLADWGITPDEFRDAEADHYRRLDHLVEAVRAPFLDVRIDGSNHVSFSDLPLLARIPGDGLGDPRRIHRIINDYTTAFFAHYLRGDAEPLVDGVTPTPYPEVTVTARNLGGGLVASREGAR